MPTARNPSITLSAQHRMLIDDLVASGRYHSASDVVREGLRLLDHREAGRARVLAEIDQAIQEGIDSGPSVEVDMDTLMAEAMRRARERRRS
jgi:antitoxin ParD1/3/4